VQDEKVKKGIDKMRSWLVGAVLLVFVLVSANSFAAMTYTYDGDAYSSQVDGTMDYGTGIPNGNWVICTDTISGVRVGLRAMERKVDHLPSNLSSLAGPIDPLNPPTYYATPGESEGVGSGLATWNFEFSYELGPYTLADVTALLAVDFDPAVDNLPTMVLDLGASGQIPGTAQVIQDSQNLGFSFWQSIPGSMPFDPYAPGEYTFGITVFDNATGDVLGDLTMDVVVVPVPGTFLLGCVGISMVGLLKRKFV